MTGNIPAEIAKRTKEEYEDKPDTLKVYTSSWFIGLLLEPKDRKNAFLDFKRLNLTYFPPVTLSQLNDHAPT